MGQELHIHIPDPPTNFIISGRKIYMSAQALYSGLNPHVRSKFVTAAKWFLFPHLRNVPVLQTRIRLDITMYNRSRGTQDPDNLYIWQKLILDSLKGRAIPDDSKKYVRRVSAGFEEGDPELFILITQGV